MDNPYEPPRSGPDAWGRGSYWTGWRAGLAWGLGIALFLNLSAVLLGALLLLED